MPLRRKWHRRRLAPRAASHPAPPLRRDLARLRLNRPATPAAAPAGSV